MLGPTEISTEIALLQFGSLKCPAEEIHQALEPVCMDMDMDMDMDTDMDMGRYVCFYINIYIYICIICISLSI
jgi:hypothetical protein